MAEGIRRRPEWVPLNEVYRHVLKHSPLPELAKIATQRPAPPLAPWRRPLIEHRAGRSVTARERPSGRYLHAPQRAGPAAYGNLDYLIMETDARRWSDSFIRSTGNAVVFSASTIRGRAHFSSMSTSSRTVTVRLENDPPRQRQRTFC